MEKSTAGTVKQTITGDDPIIRILNMNKWYEEFHVLKNINLEVRCKERIVICGPSGSGK